MSDSAAVDVALMAWLSGDPALSGLMPDGVYLDLAPSGATRFVIVSLASHLDTYEFRRSAFEAGVYLVKAVERNTSSVTANAAAARIDELLQDARIPIAGFGLMVSEREERIVYTEVDPENQDTRWQHRGGRYAVWVSPE